MNELRRWQHENSPTPIPVGIVVRWVYDECHETRGSYGYETEEATREAEDDELKKLESGEWVALGCIVESFGEEVDSLWGIVIEPEDAKLAEFFEFSMVVPTPVEQARERLSRARDEVDAAADALEVAHRELAEAIAQEVRPGCIVKPLPKGFRAKLRLFTQFIREAASR